MQSGKGIICLSVFDGISCGRIALERAGIKVDKYYASEIDKYAEKISESNYPDIIRLGDITKWREWDIESPDIIIAGSPCQGFSFAGKGLNFQDPRSALFFTFADILKHYKPQYFLLENVKMKAEHNDVISSILGEIYPECVRQTEMFRIGRLEPILINSALVSAQNRERLYWCNWKVTQPEDKGILLKDIIESDGIRCDTRNKGGKQLCKTNVRKSHCLLAREYKGIGNFMESAVVVTGGALRGRNPEKHTSRISGLPTVQMLEKRNEGKAECLTSVQKDSIIVNVIPGFENKKSVKSQDKIKNNIKGLSEKGNCLLSSCYKGAQSNGSTVISTDNITWRKLTVTECERLQTLPDGYCRAVSNSRAYHALGNGWTVDVIAHILRGIKEA